MDYFTHNDSKGMRSRQYVQARHQERQRMLASLMDRDMGCITLYMSKHELRTALQAAPRARIWS